MPLRGAFKGCQALFTRSEGSPRDGHTHLCLESTCRSLFNCAVARCVRSSLNMANQGQYHHGAVSTRFHLMSPRRHPHPYITGSFFLNFRVHFTFLGRLSRCHLALPSAISGSSLSNPGILLYPGRTNFDLGAINIVVVRRFTQRVRCPPSTE